MGGKKPQSLLMNLVLRDTTFQHSHVRDKVTQQTIKSQAIFQLFIINEAQILENWQKQHSSSRCLRGFIGAHPHIVTVSSNPCHLHLTLVIFWPKPQVLKQP